MATYQIESSAGVVLGQYEGETQADAIRAMMADAGAEGEPDADLIVREVVRSAPNAYLLNGERIDLDEFIADNADGFDADEIAAIRALAPGQSMTFGGGAAPEFVLSRESADV